jgi:hypothetical protein
MNSKVAIVIPVYKELSSHSMNEKALFEQAKKVFKSRTLFLVGPNSLDTEFIAAERFNFIPFKDKFFKDKLTYSKLLCSQKFYQSFTNYDYIQVVQTDCWLFEDQLDDYTSRGFDYIGAPWMKNGFEGKPEPELWKVGNGGFSLRKVNSFLSIIDQIQKTEKGEFPVFQDLGEGIIRTLKNKGIRNNLKHYIKNPPGEDIFWSIYVPMVFSENEFNVADTETAAHYSFETLPQFLYEKVTNQNLPMGCHNWTGNNPEFWKNHIKI